MTRPLRGTLLFVLAVLFGLISASGFVSMVLALTVNHTLSAIESAFGSLIIALLFLVLARKSWLAARKSIQASSVSADEGVKE